MIRTAYSEVGHLVHVDLCTQMGDAARLGVQRLDCLHLLALTKQISTYHEWAYIIHVWCLHQHSAIISNEERLVIDASLHLMIQCLDEAVHLSSDPPDGHPLQTSFSIHTGEVGCPSIQIPPGMLATALELRGPTHLTSVFGCSSHTIRWCALEYGLAEPCPPVYVEYEHDDGTTVNFHCRSAAMSDLSDDDLDKITSEIIDLFPNFGRCMIDGHLHHLGHHVPRSWVQASYAHVHGAPASSFGPRRIQCRVYSVPGPNSLAHHDGQHGVFIFPLSVTLVLSHVFFVFV